MNAIFVIFIIIQAGTLLAAINLYFKREQKKADRILEIAVAFDRAVVYISSAVVVYLSFSHDFVLGLQVMHLMFTSAGAALVLLLTGIALEFIFQTRVEKLIQGK